VTHVDLLCRFFCVLTLHANTTLGSQESHQFLQSVLLIPGSRAKEAEDVVLGRLASRTARQPGEKFGEAFRSQTDGLLANPGHHHRESKPRLGAAVFAMLCRAMGWTGEAKSRKDLAVPFDPLDIVLLEMFDRSERSILISALGRFNWMQGQWIALIFIECQLPNRV
jgi:hypothetical protein